MAHGGCGSVLRMNGDECHVAMLQQTVSIGQIKRKIYGHRFICFYELLLVHWGGYPAGVQHKAQSGSHIQIGRKLQFSNPVRVGDVCVLCGIQLFEPIEKMLAKCEF